MMGLHHMMDIHHMMTFHHFEETNGVIPPYDGTTPYWIPIKYTFALPRHFIKILSKIIIILMMIKSSSPRCWWFLLHIQLHTAVLLQSHDLFSCICQLYFVASRRVRTIKYTAGKSSLYLQTSLSCVSTIYLSYL